MKGIIYCAHCKDTGKKYIGQTVQPLEKRMRQHIHEASKIRKAHRNIGTLFHNKIKHYGEHAFIWCILEYDIPKKELLQRERYYIDEYKTMIGKDGYNEA